MDVQKALRELYREKIRLDGLISQLELKQQASVHEVAKPHKRGRKAMPPEERLEVSGRMTNYWAESKTASA